MTGEAPYPLMTGNYERVSKHTRVTQLESGSSLSWLSAICCGPSLHTGTFGRAGCPDDYAISTEQAPSFTQMLHRLVR